MTDDKDDGPVEVAAAASPDLPEQSAASQQSANSQLAEPQPELSAEASTEPVPETDAAPPPPSLDQARAFLRDEAVRDQPRARKADFLASKGFSTDDVDTVLGAAEATSSSAALTSSSTSTSPPIVTYPEFLARPPHPPPLVTPAGFVTALYGSAAAASVVYGTARLVLAPMAATLSDARHQLQTTTGAGLARVVQALESVVSVDVPLAGADAADTPDAADASGSSDSSDSSDAAVTAVFHRDVAVQTSPLDMPARPPTPPMAHPSMTTALQYAHLASMADSVKRLCDDCAGPDDVLAETQTAMDALRTDIDGMPRPAFSFGADLAAAGANTKYPGYVLTTRNEPDDEIRRAKENIRRVKGALLTTRTFPTAR